MIRLALSSFISKELTCVTYVVITTYLPLRLALFFDDKKLTADTIDAAKGLLDQGGDWERRSRLEVRGVAFCE